MNFPCATLFFGLCSINTPISVVCAFTEHLLSVCEGTDRGGAAPCFLALAALQILRSGERSYNCSAGLQTGVNSKSQLIINAQKRKKRKIK